MHYENIPVYWWIGGFVLTFILVILLVVRVGQSSRRKAWERAERDPGDLGASTVARIQQLERDNERLVRENEGLRSRAKELLLFHEDKDRKIATMVRELEMAGERHRLAQESLRKFHEENEQLRKEGRLQMSSRSTGEKDDVGTIQGTTHRSSGTRVDRVGNIPSRSTDKVPKREKKRDSD